MWYAFQTIIAVAVAYAYLSHVSAEQDVGHALCLGAIVALYATIILSAVLSVLRKLIRALSAMLLRPALRGHKKPDQLVHIRGSGSPRTPPLVPQIGLRRGTRDRP
jgi:hypothetical protein